MGQYRGGECDGTQEAAPMDGTYRGSNPRGAFPPGSQDRFEFICQTRCPGLHWVPQASSLTHLCLLTTLGAEGRCLVWASSSTAGRGHGGQAGSVAPVERRLGGEPVTSTWPESSQGNMGPSQIEPQRPPQLVGPFKNAKVIDGGAARVKEAARQCLQHVTWQSWAIKDISGTTSDIYVRSVFWITVSVDSDFQSVIVLTSENALLSRKYTQKC